MAKNTSSAKIQRVQSATKAIARTRTLSSFAMDVTSPSIRVLHQLGIMVMVECYGVPYIPEGQWLCRVCHVAPRDPPQCIFCPNEGGALKQTVDSSWGHLLCALWVPETDVANHIFMEPIEGVDRIPKSRWKLICYICGKPGACIQCANKSCYLAFHVSCARRAKLSIKFIGPMSNLERSQMKGYCDKHCPVLVPSPNRTNSSRNIWPFTTSWRAFDQPNHSTPELDITP
jgi:PHD-zinc-finger like domain